MLMPEWTKTGFRWDFKDTRGIVKEWRRHRIMLSVGWKVFSPWSWERTAVADQGEGPARGGGGGGVVGGAPPPPPPPPPHLKTKLRPKAPKTNFWRPHPLLVTIKQTCQWKCIPHLGPVRNTQNCACLAKKSAKIFSSATLSYLKYCFWAAERS